MTAESALVAALAPAPDGGTDNASRSDRYRRRSMPTRVLWLTKGLGPGGTERLLVELARARDPKRVELTAAYVLPWKDHLAGDLEAAGVETVCLSRRMRDPCWPLHLRRLVVDRGFDVVHSHSPVPAVAMRLVAWSTRPTSRPALVTTEHNTWTSHHWATRAANGLTSGADSVTYAVTEEVVATLRGTARRRAEVLVHGIDVDLAAARPEGERMQVRAGLGLAADDVVIGTVANLRAQKDYPTLLTAARLLVDRGVSFRLVAVGQGPLEREVAERRDQLGLHDHVLLAGFRPDAVAVMAACDVFVLASAWEGLPVAVMEATALGLPIVATSVGGIAEQLAPTEAVLVPPRDPVALADALEAVVVDPRRRAALAAAARSAATRFDVHRTMQTLTSRYEQFLDEDDGRRHRWCLGAGIVVSPDLELRPATPDDREQVLSLLRVTLGWEDDSRYRDLFAWKHERNPFGPSFAWVVERHGDIVAVRLFMRWHFVPRRHDGAGGTCGRHGDAPRPPGWRAVLGADAARVGDVPLRGCGLRLQHPERREPTWIPQARLARGGPPGHGRAALDRTGLRFGRAQWRTGRAVVRPDRCRCRDRLMAGWAGHLAGMAAGVVERPDAAHCIRPAICPLALRAARSPLPRCR